MNALKLLIAVTWTPHVLIPRDRSVVLVTVATLETESPTVLVNMSNIMTFISCLILLFSPKSPLQSLTLGISGFVKVVTQCRSR